MKFATYNHAELEPEILEFWQKNQITEKLKKRNSKGKNWSFLQGPPYTSGKVHLGTAWNTSLKDIALRYKRAHGFNVWDRNGYDVHGLPTAHKVMAKYKLETKEDIEAFGIGKFMSECKKFSLEMGNQMTKDFKRIGCTLDYSDSYMALKNDYMEGEWWMVKKAWEKKRLYRGEKVMTWCGNCETAVAKHECEYQIVKEDSIFVKFPVKGKKDEYLIIWTTTPWTIPFNLAIMANPELDYLKVEVTDPKKEKSQKEKWILAKALAGMVVQSVADKRMKVLEEFKGEKLEGLKYIHPFEKFISKYSELEKTHPNVHTVILSDEFVDVSAGSGLVHSAPGSGPEDQEACKPYNIPPFNTLSEDGYFREGTGKFEGLRAKENDDKFIEALKKEKVLIAVTEVEHDYPHCWRCHKPVIFRPTKQWFFKIEDIRDRMVKENAKVNWVPKTQAFDAWTSNLKDNSITRQRYWGTPVPIWKCNNKECGQIEVIGSIKELKRKAGKVPKDLHRPWIDKVEWKCNKCQKKNRKGKMKRIPDILDVWIDAGTCAWNCFYYPQREDYIKKFFPADLILEATEQVRLWFSMLSICSQLAMGKNCYKNVYMYGMLRDIDGVKMSKSLGNIITPDEMIEKHGADVLRYYMCQTNAGQDISFSWDGPALKSRYLQILWNVQRFLINLAGENSLNPFEINKSKLGKAIGIEEKYIISKSNSTIKRVTELFDAYRFDETIGPLEELFLELSRTYIQMIRDKSSLGTQKEKQACIYTIGHVLLNCVNMFQIIAPFISEAIYQNLKEEFGLKEESINLLPWPKADERMINKKLEQEMETAQQIIQSALAAREKAHIGLRWPIKEIVVVSQNRYVIDTVGRLNEIISRQINSKEVNAERHLPELSVSIKPNYSVIGPAYGQLSPQIIAKLAAENADTVIKEINKKGSYDFEVENEVVKITRGMLNLEHDVPDHYQEVEFKGGFVYLNVERTEELENEGFARELTRQIQNLRKEGRLEKQEAISLFVKVSENSKSRLKSFQNEIKEKVGAQSMEFSVEESKAKFPYRNEFRIKEEDFFIGFEKV